MYKTIEINSNMITDGSNRLYQGCVHISFYELFESDFENFLSLFNDGYRQKVADMLKCEADTIASKQFDMALIHIANSEILELGRRCYMFSPIKKVSELLQLFADETLKAEIIRRVFEYV